MIADVVAVVLAAGFGTRFRASSGDDISKCLVEVGGHALVFFSVAMLRSVGLPVRLAIPTGTTEHFRQALGQLDGVTLHEVRQGSGQIPAVLNVMKDSLASGIQAVVAAGDEIYMPAQETDLVAPSNSFAWKGLTPPGAHYRGGCHISLSEDGSCITRIERDGSIGGIRESGLFGLSTAALVGMQRASTTELCAYVTAAVAKGYIVEARWLDDAVNVNTVEDLPSAERLAARLGNRIAG